jgi:hypothetical protein
VHGAATCLFAGERTLVRAVLVRIKPLRDVVVAVVIVQHVVCGGGVDGVADLLGAHVVLHEAVGILLQHDTATGTHARTLTAGGDGDSDDDGSDLHNCTAP